MLKLGTMSLLVFSASCASTQYAQREPSDPVVSQAQFEKIKSLAGEWTGQFGEGDQKAPAAVRYRVTSGGSAVEETIDPGGEYEMITMYHLNSNDLTLTHYCAAGNQPRMIARSDKASAASNVIHFSFVGVSNLKTADEGHMHDLEITFLDPDHLRTEWTFFRENKPAEKARFELTRKVGSKQAKSIIETGVDPVLDDDLR